MKKMKSIIIYASIMIVVLCYSLFLLSESSGESSSHNIEEIKEQLKIITKGHRAFGTKDQEEACRYIESLLIANHINYEIQGFDQPYVELLNSKDNMIAQIAAQLNQSRDYVFHGRNILIHLDAKGTDDAVLFVSHYDCKEWGNGAGDNGLSVIAALNAVFNVEQDELTNDIYLLLSDGEELGMIGATHFVDDNEDLLKNVKLVVDLEGGMSGSYLLTRTSGLERGSIGLAKEMVSDFSGSSFLDSIFTMAGYRTDMEPFVDKKIVGMDFLRMETIEAYHNRNDNFGVMKESTMKESAKTISEMIVGFGKADLSNVANRTQVNYFPVTKETTVVLSYKVVILLFIVSLIGFIIFVYRGIKAKKYSSSKWLPAGLSVIGIIIAIGVLIFGVTIYHELEYGKYINLAMNDVQGYQDYMEAGNTSYQLFIINMLMATIITCILVWFLLYKKKIRYEIYTIMVSLFIVFGMISMVWLKGALYVAAIPLFCASIGCIVVNFLPKSKWMIHILMILGSLIIVGPIAWIIFVGLHNVMTFKATIFAGIFITIVILLTLSAICVNSDESTVHSLGN